MTHLAAYLLGVLTATVALLWALARMTSTPESAMVPRDPYVEGLLERERIRGQYVDVGRSVVATNFWRRREGLDNAAMVVPMTDK